MAYYPDLTPYHYISPKPLKDVLTVGWLAAGHEFRTGPTPAGLRANLEDLMWTHFASPMLGIHACELCHGSDPREPPDIIKVERDGNVAYLGGGEIWVPSVDRTLIYAAPTLILHYIDAHAYLPPDEFIAAVRAEPVNSDWKAMHEQRKRFWGS